MRNRFLAILIVQDLSILVVKRLLLSKKPIFLFAVEAFRCAVDSRLCTSMYSKLRKVVIEGMACQLPSS